MNLSCQESGCSLIINNDSALEQLELQGFSSININNCPKLRKVIININSMEACVGECSEYLKMIKLEDTEEVNQ